MTLKYSAGALEFMSQFGSLKDAFTNGNIEIYTGQQPANANAAATGTLLCEITGGGLTITNEVLAYGSLTLTGGTSGSVNTLTVNGVDILGGAVNFNASLTQTSADIAAQCMAKKSAVRYNVTSSGAVVTITALPGTGASPNTFVVAATVTTITKSVSPLANGVAAVNGLLFGASIGGATSKAAGQVWTGANSATGIAGWYRFYGSVADSGALDSAGIYIREDGACGVAGSGAELILTTTSLVSGLATPISNWQRTLNTN